MSILKCANFQELKMSMPKSGLLLMEGVELTEEALLDLAASLSEKKGSLQDKILHWDFGPVMTMKFEKEASNYLFSDERVPFHWDGAFHREPSYLLFYCTESEGAGGETLFSDTGKIWNDLSSEKKEIAQKVQLIFKTEKKAHYGGEITVPLKQTHPRGHVILRMGEEVETELNPVSLKLQGHEKAQELYDHLKECLYQEDYLHVHEWKKGDLLLCDNFTFLHGRRELKGNLKRSFKRIQIL